MGDDGSDRRAADDVAAIDVAAEDAIVVVVRNTVIVNRTNARRTIHIVTEVVEVRVHVGMRSRGAGSAVRSRSGLRLRMTMIVVSSRSGGVVAGTTRVAGVSGRVALSGRGCGCSRGARRGARNGGVRNRSCRCTGSGAGSDRSV